MKIIAHIKTDFPDKFGIPRQSGIIDTLKGRIVFTSEYRDPEALRGLEQFSHIWLLWNFSEIRGDRWSPTVRPPRLGGNTRIGVFATRSPFRPNNIGLSSVRLEHIEYTGKDSPVIVVSGIDLMDGTPIIDIKPYIPFTDCHPDASEGYTAETRTHRLSVICPPLLLERYPEQLRQSLISVLEQDPRPAYIDDPGRVYGVRFGACDVHFRVAEDILTVITIDNV